MKRISAQVGPGEVPAPDLHAAEEVGSAGRRASPRLGRQASAGSERREQLAGDRT